MKTQYLSNEQRGDQHIDTQPTLTGEVPARLCKVTMSDKSIAYNVLAKLDGQEFVFACQTAGHADTLASAINQASWIERS